MKKYLVIGNPIDHSLSPKLHNYWFEKNSINANYGKRKIIKSEIQKVISEIRDNKLDGINVTVPFKNNYGYMFTSGPITWHGMEKKKIVKERRCIQVNYVTFETDWKVNS